MQPFLQYVVKQIMFANTVRLENICIVVPNRRTALYIKKYISESIDKAVILPEFFTIDEFASLLSGLEPANNLELLAILYQAYNESSKKNNTIAQPFDDFISWASILISDFNDIDAHRADASDVFSYLSEAKAIQQWNPESRNLTDFQKKYLAFYNSLYSLYSVFVKQLLAQNKAYQGLMYKVILEEKKAEAFLNKWEKLIFVGFNAFTIAEEHITDFFIKNQKAELFYDFDNFYVKNKLSQAGVHIRKNMSKWGEKKDADIFDFFKNYKKNIFITGIPKHVGQAKYAAHLLSQMPFKDNPSQTAVVMPSEDMLFPMLNSIPDCVNSANVTMGYPLEKTTVFDFFDSIICLKDNALKIFRLKQTENVSLHLNDILKITQNSFLSTICFYDKEMHDVGIELLKLNNQLKEENRLFLSTIQLNDLLKRNLTKTHPLFDIFRAINEVENPDSIYMTSILINVLHAIKRHLLKLPEEVASLNMDIEFLFHYETMLESLQDFFTKTEGAQITSFKSLHKMLARNLKVTFLGEPLSGLQIMGILETRNLDFENAIILSVNEGVLPPDKSNNSFIPADIRRHFSLPMYDENESVFAYHFFRLMQRAKNIYLLYNTEADFLGSGEKSRFITQLMYELPKYNPQIVINENVLSIPVLEDNNDYTIIIDKSDDVLFQLKEKLKKGISPSSLAVYLQCSLRFYLQHVIGIAEQQEADETLDAAQIGSAIHQVLEELYTPLIGISLAPNDLLVEQKVIDDYLELAFKKNHTYVDTAHGKNLILKKMAKKYIINFLNEEIKYIQELEKDNEKLTVLYVEEKLETTLILDTVEGQFEVKLNGKADRIDSVGKLKRVLDYKTGSVKKEDVILSDFNMLMDENISPKIVQLLTYAYLFSKRSEEYLFQTGFISLKDIGSNFKFLSLPDGNYEFNKEVFNYYEVFLKNTLETLLNRNISICQTDNKDNCTYCDFVKLCQRN